MNINELLLHIQRSDMDDAIKSNLITILDKAIHDGDTVARLEEGIKIIKKDHDERFYITDEDVKKAQNTLMNEPYQTAFVTLHLHYNLHKLQSILHGDKKPDGC